MEISLKFSGDSNYRLILNDQTNNIYDELKQTIETQFNLNQSQFTLARNGLTLSRSSQLSTGDSIRICPKVLGGKGGFGSLLRAFGKQITMSTNKDACRDLTGRRIKQVNNILSSLLHVK
jgi:hypothetical protein